jgi:hypothetical protein
MDLGEIGLEVVDWISMASGYGERAGCVEHGNETGSHWVTLGPTKRSEFLDQLRNY